MANPKVDALIAKARVAQAIAAEYTQEQVDNMVNDYRQNISMQGMDFEQYLGMMGMDMRMNAETTEPSTGGYGSFGESYENRPEDKKPEAVKNPFEDVHAWLMLSRIWFERFL